MSQYGHCPFLETEHIHRDTNLNPNRPVYRESYVFRTPLPRSYRNGRIPENFFNYEMSHICGEKSSVTEPFSFVWLQFLKDS